MKTHTMCILTALALCLPTSSLLAQDNPSKSTSAKTQKAQKTKKAKKKTNVKRKKRKTRKTRKKRRKRYRLTKEQVKKHNEAVLANPENFIEKGRKRDFKWKYITIHHTATRTGNIEIFSRFHAKKFKDPDGLEYHFLIGNGRGMPKGYIGIGRWNLQKRSIHVYNIEKVPDSITVSLVGNFHKYKMKDYQYKPLVKLVAKLMTKYKIPLSRVTTHTTVDSEYTVCPGKHFPLKKLRIDLAKATPIIK